MAPKKKGGKRADDDWESEALGETPSVAETNGTSNPPAEEEMGGGLMAALAKNRGKRAKKGKVVEDFVEGEDPPGAEDGATNGINLAGKAPDEATADDLFGEPTKGKGNKGGKNAKSAPAAAAKKDEEDDDDDAEDAGATLKTGKQKEKEKKEREKQRKKEQAAKKKAAAPAPVPVPDKEDEKVAAKLAPPPETKAPTKSEPEAIGKSKKKVPAGLAALQKQLEQNKKREEEAARLQKEEEEREREAERLEQERLQKEAEAKTRRKEKEKEKKELLKKQGLLLTDAEKKRRQKMENAKQQLLASGVKIAGLDEDGAEDTKKADKKSSYDKRRKGPKKVDEQTLLAEAQKAAEAHTAQLVEERERLKAEEEAAQRKAEEEAARTADANDDEEEDWEKVAEEDDVKESWDAESDEEESVPEEKPKATPAPAAAAPKAVNGTSKPQEAPKQENLPHRPHIDRPIESDSDSESDSDPEIRSATQRMLAQKKAEAAARRAKEQEDALAARSKDNLRSPICCILGHVDTGKTKLLDKIRQTNVQEGEAGGITQQIGATYFPAEALEQKILPVNQDGSFKFQVPGLLVIDTPGHESFTNLRSRGSSLCNMAILVVDIMHGLEPQTLESMRLLRERKTPFIVALNKIDRLYNWKKIDNNGFQESLALQSKGVQNEFANRLEQTKLAFAEQGFNSELYYENKSMAKFVSLVPTSAHTGEGIPDLLKLLVQLSQERMTSKLMYLSTVECTVLEVKVIEGLGTTIDVVLSNGILREGDRIVLCGLNGAITTNIRALLTPAPMKELRVKSAYVHNQMAKASLGVKIAANDLEHAIAGSRLMVVGPNDDEEDLEEEVMGDIENLMSRVSKTGRGVSVQASTLGSLEALLEFLKVSKIPVANISIGPVYKRDVMQAGIMLEKAKEYAVMLCFDVKVDPAAQEYADQNGIKIFTADIIYHLFDNFTQHMAQLAEQKKEESKMLAVFPCVLTPVQVFNKKDPIVIGVDVTEGALRMHTPIAVVRHNGVTNTKEIISVGRVTSIERDHKQIQVCKKGQPSVAVKIEGPNQPMYGRQLEDKDILYSLISRVSIDTLKEHFRSEVTMDEWALIKKLKVTFDIP